MPLTHPTPHWTVQKAKAAGVEVLGDIELFARTVNAAEPWKRPKVAAITGTNGKSTTTALLGHMLKAAGKDARLGGNIGAGVLGLEEMHGGAVYVLELSSYQLDLTSSLKADAAVLLNVSPDHLDRHGGMDGYVAAKRRVFLNQGKGDTAVVGVDDAWGQAICTELLALNRRTIAPVSSGRAMGRGLYVLQGLLYDATGDRAIEVADLTRAKALPGRHNWQNAAAAYACALALGVSPDDAAEGLMSFPGLVHRMEDVGAIGRVRFVNDSKATNADAARQAMCALPKFYWIVGGRPKAGRHRAPDRPVRPGGDGLPDRRGERGVRPHDRRRGAGAALRRPGTCGGGRLPRRRRQRSRRGGAAVSRLRLLRPVPRLRSPRRRVQGARAGLGDARTAGRLDILPIADGRWPRSGRRGRAEHGRHGGHGLPPGYAGRPPPRPWRHSPICDGGDESLNALLTLFAPS